MDISIFSPAIEKKLEESNDLSKIIFLENHPEYNTHYLVESFDPKYIHDFKDIIGDYRSISIFKVDQLRKAAEDLGYEHIIYLDDPSKTIELYQNLNDPYPCQFNVELKPFQLQGFNYCKDLKSD